VGTGEIVVRKAPFWALAIGLALSACAATPQKTLSNLNMTDPKFSSPECVDIRGRSLAYDDKVGERATSGLLLGLFLGPLGIPIAASVDAKQDDERYAFNREITLRCVTGGEDIVAKQDAERQHPFQTQAAVPTN